MFMINVYIAFVHSHKSYAVDLYLNTRCSKKVTPKFKSLYDGISYQN